MSLLRSIFYSNFQRRSLSSSRILKKREFTDIEKKLGKIKQQNPEERHFADRHFLKIFSVGLAGLLVFWNHIQQYPELHRTRDNRGAWVPTEGVPASALVERAQVAFGQTAQNIKESVGNQLSKFTSSKD